MDDSVKQAILSTAAGLARPVVYMMVGIPGSGKSTIAAKLVSILDCKVYSADEVRYQLTGDAANQRVNRQAWDLVHQYAKSDLSNGLSVIIDATHTRAEVRRAAIRKYRMYGAKSVVAVCVDVAFETAMARNQNRQRVVRSEVMESMNKVLMAGPVVLQDGFDRIIHINNEPPAVFA